VPADAPAKPWPTAVGRRPPSLACLQRLQERFGAGQRKAPRSLFCVHPAGAVGRVRECPARQPAPVVAASDGLVPTGDLISLDVRARTLRLELTASEQAFAPGRTVAVPPVANCGWARLYADHVLQAGRGCDLDFLVGSSGAEGAAAQPPGRGRDAILTPACQAVLQPWAR
jgi:hypothetical protein